MRSNLLRKSPQKVKSWSEINKPVITRRYESTQSTDPYSFDEPPSQVKSATKPKRGQKRQNVEDNNDGGGPKVKTIENPRGIDSKGPRREEANKEEEPGRRRR